jgi:hypothetical protein
MMTDEKRKASFPAGLGIMDKIWEWQWIIRFIYIVLFADLALLVYSGQGILTWLFRHLTGPNIWVFLRGARRLRFDCHQ